MIKMPWVSRWENAYGENLLREQGPSAAKEKSNRRATIILDLIIQASDVSYTMQHVTVY